jgi:hypothetical protein
VDLSGTRGIRHPQFYLRCCGRLASRQKAGQPQSSKERPSLIPLCNPIALKIVGIRFSAQNPNVILKAALVASKFHFNSMPLLQATRPTSNADASALLKCFIIAHSSSPCRCAVNPIL